MGAVLSAGRRGEQAPLDGRERFSHLRALGVGAALVVGTLCTAAGAGLAGRYAQKVGLSPTTMAGTALLLLGVVLLGYSTRRAWRFLRGWRRLWLVPTGLLVLLVAFSVAQGVMLAVVPPTSLGPGTPAGEGLAYRDVAFRTADGVRLSAWLVPSRNGAAVVVLHGAGSTRTGAMRQAGVLGRHGYGVLLVDGRGHGRSGGEGNDGGWYGDADVTAAVTYLARQPGVVSGHVGVLGLSMGGEEAIGAAAAGSGLDKLDHPSLALDHPSLALDHPSLALDHPSLALDHPGSHATARHQLDPRVAAVVAEGATARTAADKDLWLPHGVDGTIQRALDAVTYGVVDVLTPGGPPTTLRDAVARATHTRFLLVTAGEQPDEQAAADVLHAAAPGRVAVWRVPGADHTQGLAVAPVQWRHRVVGFLDATLLPARGHTP